MDDYGEGQRSPPSDPTAFCTKKRSHPLCAKLAGQNKRVVPESNTNISGTPPTVTWGRPVQVQDARACACVYACKVKLTGDGFLRTPNGLVQCLRLESLQQGGGDRHCL